jgi:hypothetical protein
MALLRTMRGIIRALAMCFVIAQFAGVVASPLAHAHSAPAMAAAHADHQRTDHRHASGHDHQGCPHQSPGQCGDQAGYCCALHAFFAGVLPPVLDIDAVTFVGQRLAPQPTAVFAGLGPGRLDRPPRPLL